MFYNILFAIKYYSISVVAIIFYSIFALLLISKAVNNVTNQCR